MPRPGAAARVCRPCSISSRSRSRPEERSMGKRNQEKRRAKQQARRKRGPTPPRGPADEIPFGSEDAGESWDALPPAEMLSDAVIEGARAYVHGDAAAPKRCAADLVRGRQANEPALIGT